MAQFLAIEWSRHEVRFVLAAGKGSSVDIEAAGSLPLPQGAQGDSVTPEVIGTTLRKALAPHKSNRAKTLVSIDRASVELHRLSLPPASDVELPTLVANQIAREFSSASDASIVDFVADAAAPDQPRQVTAAVLSSQQHQAVRTICSAAGLTPQRIVLRPYAAAALYSLSAAPKSSSCLLINVVDDEVDLTIVEGEKATFSRTVRFPRVGAEIRGDEWLYAEITRTVLAAPHSAAGGSVTGACLFGREGERSGLCELIRERMNISVETLDPFAAIGAGSECVNDAAGRFASLVGLIAVESRVGTHEIDFVNPRKPPVPRNRRRPAIIAAARAAALVLGFGYTVWDEAAQDEAKIADLKQQLKTLNGQIKKASEKQVVVDAISEWQAGDVLWLDELRDLSKKMPNSRDLTVLRMSMSPARAGGGVITLQGAARNWTVVEQMAQSLRDPYHQVGVPHQQGRSQDEAHGWHFDTSIAVAKRSKEEYLNPASDEPAESKGTADTDEGKTAALTK